MTIVTFNTQECVMKIVAYLESKCERSAGIDVVMKKYDLEYETRDISHNENQYAEMVRKTGQSLAPCVEIDGVMLVDTSGQEIEKYLLSKSLVKSDTVEPDALIDTSRKDEEHEAMRSKTTRFF